ncbi:FAD-binding oxidoreductase [Bradyrhizobium arachidis]|uniref:NAD(P)/FAD-dependent oxidoreductase n=1 Tax=Bradyrhizobium arachidis TaxID=858423 RepID=UPI002161D764|nr:FAD-dependent oxidoreductase [Bradyrhizobium arachidis]UVO38824.1 FAD-binding oxidoreductase [Bradyrhizobium arachidis]
MRARRSTRWRGAFRARLAQRRRRHRAAHRTTGTTAIVHPHRFTSVMMNAAIVHGAELRDGRVTSTVRDADGTTVKGVEVDGSVIDADAVVIAMGPGSLLAAQWMSLPAIHGERSPSIVYDTGTPVSADALFLEMEIYGKTTPIEVFPRPDGSTYVTACPDTAAFPTDPADVKPEPNLMDWLQQMSERLSPLFRPEKIIAKQACFRPVTDDGLPLIGRVPRDEGLHVASGHGVWGIFSMRLQPAKR